MTEHRLHPILALPILLLAGIVAGNAVTSSSIGSKEKLVDDLQIERRLDAASDTVQDMVHDKASGLADRTRSPKALRADKRKARGSKRMMPAARPSQDTRPIPQSSSIPTRRIGDQEVPDFDALRGDSARDRTHSGRLPPR
jgi:hypothetical protein